MPAVQSTVLYQRQLIKVWLWVSFMDRCCDQKCDVAGPVIPRITPNNGTYSVCIRQTTPCTHWWTIYCSFWGKSFRGNCMEKQQVQLMLCAWQRGSFCLDIVCVLPLIFKIEFSILLRDFQIFSKQCYVSILGAFCDPSVTCWSYAILNED